MIKPLLLKRGDPIMIVAPARKIGRAEIDAACSLLSTWGFSPLLGKNLFTDAHSYLSATDEQRFADLQDAINDPSIKAIIAARGGYGSTRIVDQLNLEALKKFPKWLVGFSDITALHLKFFRESVMSIHGNMPILFSRDDSAASNESLVQLLLTGNFRLNAPHHPLNRTGSVSGKLVGGNLSLIVESLGTRTEPDTSGCILVLEEIDEYRYRLDRMLTTLRRAGKFKNLKGLAIGHMTSIKESELPFGDDVAEMVVRNTKEYEFPVAFNFPTGHENPNLAWTHGGEAVLDITLTGSELRSYNQP
jgi:muramoyltetrapeptide carboxypeptidase